MRMVMRIMGESPFPSKSNLAFYGGALVQRNGIDADPITPTSYGPKGWASKMAVHSCDEPWPSRRTPGPMISGTAVTAKPPSISPLTA